MSRRRAIFAVRSRLAREAERVALENEAEAVQPAPVAPVEADDVREKLEADYEKVFGKKPRANMKDETIAERLQEHADAERDNKERR